MSKKIRTIPRENLPLTKLRRKEEFDVEKFMVLARKVRKIFEREEKERREREFEKFTSGFQYPA